MSGMVVNRGPSFGGLTWDATTGTYQDMAKRSGTQYNETDPYSQSAPSPLAAGGALSTAAGNSAKTGADYTVDPFGSTAYSNKSAQDRQTMAQEQQYKAANRDSMLSLLQTNPAAPSSPTISHGGVQSNEADARAAAFARAKDQAGQIARSSLTSIASNLAGRNMSGGGLQALQEAGAINGATQPLQELTRDQMISDTNRSADIADQEYQGGIQQRGQDLSNRASYLSLLRSLY